MPNPGGTIALALLLLTSFSTVETTSPDAIRQSPAQTGGGAAGGQTLVTTIPQDYETPPDGWTPVCSADRTRCAYRARKGAETFVVVDGTPGSGYEQVRNIVFSGDGRHIAYAAERKASWMVVTDGKEGPPFQKIDKLMFLGNVPIYLGSRAPEAPAEPDQKIAGSSDIVGFRSSRHAGIQIQVVVGDRPDDVPVVEDRFRSINDLTVSPDGKFYAYVMGVSAGPYGLWLLMVNGREVAEDHDIKIFSFTKDGRVAFSSRTGSPANGRSKVLIGEEVISEHSENIVAGTIGPDGRRLAFVACGKAAEGCALMLDGKVARNGAIENLTFGPNGVTLAYTERQAGGQSRVIVGDQAGPLVDAVTGPIIFSADGQRHAYPAKLGAKSVVVADGIVGPTFDAVGGVHFSEDSKHLAYAATKDGANHIVLDQVAGRASFAWVTAPDFDSAGRTLRFVTQEGRRLWRRSIAVGR